MMLTARVASGALWLVSARLATKALDLVALLIVARLLVPADFGLFSLAASVLLVMNAVTDLSLSNAIIQMRDPPEAVYDTAFTLNLVRGLVLCAALVSAAWPFAELYGDARLAEILLALATVPLLRSFASPRMAFLQRQLQFSQAFYLEAAGKIAAFVASVVAAYLTRSYWALVAGMIAAPALSSLLSYRFAPYRPKLGLTDWKPIFAFSGWLTLSNVANTLNWQADRFFIGGALGTSVLGQYTVGSELASLPTNAPVMPIMQALYAGFAKLSQDVVRLKNAYLTSQAVVIGIALPIAVAVSVFAHSIIEIAIGPDWAAAGFVVQVLAPVFALQMLTAPAQSIAMVRNRTDIVFKRDLVALALRVPLILAGLYLAGLEGVVWARVVSGIAIIGLNLMLMKSILGSTILEQVMAPWRSYVSGAAMAGFMVFVAARLGLDDAADLSAVPALAGLTVAGFALYATIHMALWGTTRPHNSAERKIIDIARMMIGKTARG